MAEQPHALVLGGTGFLGEPLVQQLAARGVRLACLVHRQRPASLPDHARLIPGSLGSFDLEWCRSDPPHWVFHCARLSGRGVAGRLFAAWRGRSANRRLLRTLSALPSPPRLVYASGSLMYGNHGDEWVDETTPLTPVSFAREYVLAERPFLEPGPLPVMMVRPGWVLGDGSWFRAFYLEAHRSGGSIPLLGEGRNWMTFAHREDVATMMQCAMEKGTPGAAYNLAPGEALRQGDFATAVAAELSCSVKGRTLPSLRGRWDHALADAFGSSIRLRSQYSGMFAGLPLKWPDPVSAMRAAVAAHKERIRRETTAASG